VLKKWYTYGCKKTKIEGNSDIIYWISYPLHIVILNYSFIIIIIILLLLLLLLLLY